MRKSSRQQMKETYAAATSFTQSKEEEMKEVMDGLRSNNDVGAKFRLLLKLVPRNGNLTDKWRDFGAKDMETLVNNIVLGLVDGQRDNGFGVHFANNQTKRPVEERIAFMRNLVNLWTRTVFCVLIG